MRTFSILLLPLFLSVILFTTGCGTRTTDSASKPHCQLAALKAQKSATIGVKFDAPPFGYQVAGMPTGFDVDIIRSVMGRIGIDDITFVPVTSANRLSKVADGSIDLAIASTTITRSREADVDFSIAYFQDGQNILVPQKSQINSYQDLAKKKVGAVEGSTSIHNLKQVAPDAVVSSFKDYNALAQALAAGELDAISSDAILLTGLSKRLPGGLSAWRLAGPVFSTEPYGIILPENQSNLRDAINSALMAMWQEREYQLIFDTWFGEGTPMLDRSPFR